MAYNKVCSLKRYIPFYDCDYKKRIKLSAILKYAAEIAGYDYTVKGYGHNMLWEKGMVFLLSRVSVKIDEYPVHSDDITYETWECGKKGAMFLRDTDFIVGGKTMISYRAGWILANPISRKIIRPSAFFGDMPQIMDRECTAPDIDKIRYAELIKVCDRIINISDLDPNGHVYNAAYADICDDTLAREDFEKGIDTFRINYVSEATFGEKLTLYHEKDGNRLVVVGRTGEKVCFEAEYNFR